jgi:Lon-like ATP-dependent protease
MLALPIARRPLFPGFYKAVVVRNPAVVAAIKEMMKRGQPYLGAFLLKDENTDSDVITDVNSVHPVGVFAQITSVFAAAGRSADGGPNGEIEEGLTAVLYPHRRIKITELVKAGGVRMEEVEQQEEPQTVEPPTPPPTPPPSPTEKHITESTSGISLSPHTPNYFFLIPTHRPRPNGVFAQT